MIHIQSTVPGWLEAVQRMPAGTLVKAIDQGQVFREVKDINSGINTVLRHYYHNHQHFGGSWDDNLQRARDFFATFIDDTFMADIAPYCDFIEEWNEYLASSHTGVELQDRHNWAAAVAHVWHNEYRWRAGLEHIRLVLCNTAIGNDIHHVFAEIADKNHGYDCLLAYHPYSWWTTIDGEHIRAANDWADLSGRWERMDADYRSRGLYVDWLFTEAGPFEAVETGWRHPRCLDHDTDAYVEAMRIWIREVKETHAYQNGRVYGFALFTTGGASMGWEHFETQQPELNLLASMVAQEWDSNPNPDPDPVGRGEPRIQYPRVYNVIPQDATEERAVEIFRQGWREAKQTSGGSYDDAGIGDLDDRLAVLWDIPLFEAEIYLDWYSVHYPGVVVQFVNRGSNPAPFFDSPVEGIPLHMTHPFDEPRSWGPHEGVDLRAKDSDGHPVNILAMAGGWVLHASNLRRDNGQPSAYGNYVIVEHSNGYITWYCHLASMSVQAGDRVWQGDVLGRAGSTGRSTGVHLHLNIQKVGGGLSGYIINNVVDPADYLPL